ncbi:MAG: ATP-binding cassette domain-containing protein [Spirochaetota bacterium]|nr:ATP-binding cassette domain-containing protein [Spirochaetota bacterium]
MIRLENISMIFNQGTPNENIAIRNINMEIEKGDFVTIIGSNGAGKTTLFNLISGNIFPTQGDLFIKGKNVTRHPEYKRAKYIGRIFQNPLLGTATNMTIEDNMMITFSKGFKGLKISLNNKMRAVFREQLSQLDMDLENRLKDDVGLLSGGQRQALTLLMMVISKPTLILLDEHTAALDPKNAQIVLDLTTRFIKEYNLTAIMITHNMSHAIEYGNRLMMLDKGEIILDIKGEEEKKLTVDSLVEKFHKITNTNIENDEILLSTNI